MTCPTIFSMYMKLSSLLHLTLFVSILYISKMSSEFVMEDLGPLSYFLGIFVSRRPKRIFLCYKKYGEEMIERARMSFTSSSQHRWIPNQNPAGTQVIHIMIQQNIEVWYVQYITLIYKTRYIIWFKNTTHVCLKTDHLLHSWYCWIRRPRACINTPRHKKIYLWVLCVSLR